MKAAEPKAKRTGGELHFTRGEVLGLLLHFPRLRGQKTITINGLQKGRFFTLLLVDGLYFLNLSGGADTAIRNLGRFA